MVCTLCYLQTLVPQNHDLIFSSSMSGDNLHFNDKAKFDGNRTFAIDPTKIYLKPALNWMYPESCRLMIIAMTQCFQSVHSSPAKCSGLVQRSDAYQYQAAGQCGAGAYYCMTAPTRDQHTTGAESCQQQTLAMSVTHQTPSRLYSDFPCCVSVSSLYTMVVMTPLFAV